MIPDHRTRRLRAIAIRRGLRMTPQREVLLRVLGRFRHHPTADELYRRVRRVLPSISQATVYRNVQTLVRAGVLATLERAGGAVRYDANPDEHHHFVCSRCGEVADVYLAGVRFAVDRGRSGLRGARIEGCHLHLRGRCARCARTPGGPARWPSTVSRS